MPGARVSLRTTVEAVRWYRMAAEQGDATALYNLGVMYTNGEGVLADAAEAVRWYRMAAREGHVTAQYNLGVSYARGIGVLADLVLAHMWYNIAGANGHELARELRESLESMITREDIGRATELARTCMASNYWDCGP